MAGAGEQLGEFGGTRRTRCPGVAHDPEVKAALLLMVIAGRAQRLQALALGLNIVLHRRITVAEQLLEVRGRIAFGPTKTGSGLRTVTVTVPRVAAEALAEHLGVYAEASPDGLVFSAERGCPIRRSNFTRWVWIPTTRAAGVEGFALP
jgi:hypothetical protein